jgi:tRNA nucleotidyltransferase/poly(A) polymerase
MVHQFLDLPGLESRLRADPVLIEISRALGSAECWVVGGWIRDRTLGLDPPDLDLVVRGAEAAQAAATDLGATWKTTPRLLGRPERAVWRLRSPRCKVEIWPTEGQDLEADALRRDYTCNALFWRLPKGPLFDPTGGFRDIVNRKIRAISRTNLKADPVRLLRGVRLTATLDGFSLDTRTRQWIADLAPSLANAPRERVGAELLNLAGAPHAFFGLQNAIELDLLRFAEPRPSPAAPVFSASLENLERLTGRKSHPAPAAITQSHLQAILSWLVSGWPPEHLKHLNSFSWPKALTQNIGITISRSPEAQTVVRQTPADRREFIARCGLAFPTVLALAAAVDSGQGGQAQPWRRWWKQWVRSGQAILNPTPLLSTVEVSTLTATEPGPQLGQILRNLERATIRREIRSPNGARRRLRTLF